MPPLLKIAELLVQFESIDYCSSAGHELAMKKPAIIEGLKPLLVSSDPSIANAARRCMQAMDEGMHSDFPIELAEATKELMERGADPLVTGIDGECALQKAATATSWSIHSTVLLTMAHPTCRKLTKSDVDQIQIPQEVKNNKKYLYTIAFINAIEDGEDISTFGPLFDKGEKVLDRSSYTPKYIHLPSVINPNGYYKGQSFLYYAVKHGRLDVIEFLREKGAKLQKCSLKGLRGDYDRVERVKNPHYNTGYDQQAWPEICDFLNYAADQKNLYLFGALLDFIDDPAKKEEECRLFDERTANSEQVRNEKRKQRLAIHTGVAKTQEAITLPPQVLNLIGEHILHLPRNPYAKDDTDPTAAASAALEGKTQAEN